MAYEVQRVLLSGTGAPFVGLPSSLCGFPSTCNYILYSEWVCLGTGGSRSVGMNFPGFALSISVAKTAIAMTIGYGSSIFNGSFAVSINNLFSHVLISMDPTTQRIHVYVNDAPVSLASGGWVGSGPFNFTMGSTWTFNASGSTAPGSGVGDVWSSNMPSFVDLSIVANRRKFINANLSPVDLGNTGSGPFGTQPPLFLTVRPGDSNPSHFVNNNGFGGAWTIGGASVLEFEPDIGCVMLEGSKTLTDSELFFSSTGGFVDLAVEANRRKFIAAGGTPAWMERNGVLPFSTPPAVYLTTLGPPLDFAQNNGAGGGFAPSGTVDAAGGPGCTPYYVTEAAGPAANPEWRLTVSDDGGRTWSRLVKPRSAGALGEYLTRLRWLKMGQSRERMIRLECTDPVRRNIVGVYIDAGQGMS